LMSTEKFTVRLCQVAPVVLENCAAGSKPV